MQLTTNLTSLLQGQDNNHLSSDTNNSNNNNNSNTFSINDNINKKVKLSSQPEGKQDIVQNVDASNRSIMEQMRQ